MFPSSEFRPSVWHYSMPRVIRLKLVDMSFDPDSDCIIALGPSPLLISAIAAALSVYKRVSVLYWNASSSTYVKREETI
jgi:hypothetical protein